MKIVAMLIWLALPASAYGVYAAYGTPHMIFEYTFTGGDRYRLGSGRHYTSCNYVGWFGSRTVTARNGPCPWVRFFHAVENQ